jgi:hypothetical protein
MELAISIVPIFIMIALGVVGGRLGLLPPEFVGPANRLAFYLAIPALIFRVLAQVHWREALQLEVVLFCLAAMLGVWAISFFVSGRLFPGQQDAGTRASWVHCTFQGNQGFLGLAVIYYALGDSGLQAAGLIAAAVILLQNILAVVTLSSLGQGRQQWMSTLRSIGLNPVIISALAGVGLSLSGLVLPGFLDRTLLMLGNLGLPLALLIIGATLAETPLKSGLVRLSGLACLKLLVAPGLGLVLLLLWPAPFLPAQAALILLCAPTATVTVILAWQMGGDPALASSAVSFTHALSPLAYYLWLYLGGILLK